MILCAPSVIGEQVDPEDPNYVRLKQYSEIGCTVAKDTVHYSVPIESVNDFALY